MKSIIIRIILIIVAIILIYAIVKLIWDKENEK